MPSPIAEAIQEQIAKEIRRDKTTEAFEVTAARRFVTGGITEVIELSDERETQWVQRVARMQAAKIPEDSDTWKAAAARHARTMQNLHTHENSFIIKKL